MASRGKLGLRGGSAKKLLVISRRVSPIVTSSFWLKVRSTLEIYYFKNILDDLLRSRPYSLFSFALSPSQTFHSFNRLYLITQRILRGSFCMVIPSHRVLVLLFTKYKVNCILVLFLILGSPLHLS